MEQIQFIQTTPEQLKSEILSGVEKQIAQLKKDFQPKEPTEYLTREETANLLSIDLSTLWSWTRKKKLKAYGIGARVYYRRDEVEQSLIKLYD